MQAVQWVSVVSHSAQGERQGAQKSAFESKYFPSAQSAVHVWRSESYFRFEGQEEQLLGSAPVHVWQEESQARKKIFVLI